jgi:hypothetical protein
MKFMISTYATQADYDAMGGKPGANTEWSPEDFAAMGAFMESFNRELDESGELVETRGLDAPRAHSTDPTQGGPAGRDGRTVCGDAGGARRVLDRRVRELRSGDRDRGETLDDPRPRERPGTGVCRRPADHRVA